MTGDSERPADVSLEALAARTEAVHRSTVDLGDGTATVAGVARRATRNDVPALVRLRRLMFAEMGIDISETSWEAPAAELFVGEMAAGRLVTFVVDGPDGSGVVASGAVQFEANLPAPHIPHTQRGYISTMSTDVEWRSRGYARQILAALLDECDRRRVRVTTLHATPFGRPLYESVGFGQRGGSPEMRRIAPVTPSI